jgi:hypothetical protein
VRHDGEVELRHGRRAGEGRVADGAGPAGDEHPRLVGAQARVDVAERPLEHLVHAARHVLDPTAGVEHHTR